MNEVSNFVVGLALTMGAVFFALLYLRRPLQVILADLCGTADRARFWSAFSNLTLFLVPFVLALDHRTDSDAGQASIFAISGQMESAIIGLVASVIMLGFVLSIFIARNQPPHVVETNGHR